MEKKRICIDAGHYGKYNRSPVVPSYYESDMVWKLHLMQKEILEGYGFEVILTRAKQGTDKKLYNRGLAAKGCVLFISDHSNACGTEGVDYPVVYRAYDNAGDSNRLALELAGTIASVMGTSKPGRTATRRGSSGGEYYGVLRGARDAGLTDYYILEHSFHTNTRAAMWLLDDGNLRRLAEAECLVIARHYGMAGDVPEEPGSAGMPDGAVPGQAADSTVDSNGKNDGSMIPFLVTTTCEVLNIRTGPGTGYPVAGQISEVVGKKNKYTVVEEKDGWGRLKSGAGWISLAYAEKEGEAAGAPAFIPYLVTTTCEVLNIRTGPGTSYPVAGRISEAAGRKNTYTIVEEKDGWGRLKSGAGWIKLSHTGRAS